MAIEFTPTDQIPTITVGELLSRHYQVSPLAIPSPPEENQTLFPEDLEPHNVEDLDSPPASVCWEPSSPLVPHDPSPVPDIAQQCPPTPPMEPLIASPVADEAPILSVDIPTTAYCLSDGPPTVFKIHELTELITDSSLATAMDCYLDVSSPLYMLYSAYLMNLNIIAMAHVPAADTNCSYITHFIHHNAKKTQCHLLIALHQLGMLTFLQDLRHYLLALTTQTWPISKELYHALAKEHCRTLRHTTPTVTPAEVKTPISTPNLPAAPTPQASITPFSAEETHMMERIEAAWTGADGRLPLPTTHSHAHQTCYECGRLGHFKIDCPFHQCSSCLHWAPGHILNRCPLRHHTASPSPSRVPPPRQMSLGSSSSRSSGSSETPHHPRRHCCTCRIRRSISLLYE
ncbi:hypothetical protein J3R83DRAFT_6686 [Lanmaoa asiatica]|nr:hypothetical protein J3R83DRAFT_6686 [Lanmaoa asiatica]